MKLERDFYVRTALEVAKDLPGHILVRNSADGVTKGRIIEAEAYMGEIDAAAHSYMGRRTGRTEIMFAPGGCAYVYLIYGMHCCMNVVCNLKDVPQAVLIRVLEPIEGIGLMWKRRPKAKKDVDLCSGPGKLCAAMNITRAQNGADMAWDEIYIERAEGGPFQTEALKRVNIDYAGEAKDYPWRFRLV